MLFKERLREMREGAGLTQEQLAERAGLSVHTLRTYEYGQRLPGYGVVLHLSKALGTDCRAFEKCDDFQGGTPGARAEKPAGKKGKGKGEAGGK